MTDDVAALDDRVKHLREELEGIAGRFRQEVAAWLPTFPDGEGQQAAEADPARANELGKDGLARVKSELEAATPAVLASAARMLASPSLWPHTRDDFLGTSEQEMTGIFGAGTRMDGDIRLALGGYAPVFRAHGFARRDHTREVWKSVPDNREQTSYTHSFQAALPYSAEMNAAAEEYRVAIKKVRGTAVAANRARRERDQAQARGLWNDA